MSELDAWYAQYYGKKRRGPVTLDQMKLFNLAQTHAPELMPRPQIDYFFSVLKTPGLVEEMSKKELDFLY